jgi:glyoxylase-like metal-dependent hydrolase (beta-lactamase superfamily II)
MYEVSRRDLILGAAGAGLMLGLDKPVAFIGAAQAQRAADSLKYMVGDIEVFAVHDGAVERKIDANFVKNASLDQVVAALKAGGLGETFQNTYTMTALRTGGKLVLIDTGFGANGPPTCGKLADNMKAAGLDPAKVDTVIISHFHGDHINGLWVKETSAPIFPNAEILMPETEARFWLDPERVEKVPEAQKGIVRRMQSTFPSWKNVKMFQDGAEVAKGVRAVLTPGHTVGHMSFQVSSGSQQLFVIGDAITVPTLFARNPDWHVMFDMDGAKAAETRRNLMDRIVAEKATIAGYHFGFPNVGKIAKDGNGYAFTAVKA